jgi:quercetin dioxygenase-like cupin family protein
MDCSRRELTLLFSAAAAAAQVAPGSEILPSTMYRFEDLPVRLNGQNRGRAVLRGKTRKGSIIQVHETELAPGLAPHAPHHHVHEEMIFVREGALEVTIGGKTERLGPGSVAYVASNEEHGWRNAGTTQAHYFVLALGPGE